MEMRKRVLLVEDNPLYYRHIVDPLHERYEVTEVSSLREAEWFLTYKVYDLLIVDMMMQTAKFNEFQEFHAGLVFYDTYVRIKFPKMPTIIWSVINDGFDDYKNQKQSLGENVDSLYFCNKEDLLDEVDRILN